MDDSVSQRGLERLIEDSVDKILEDEDFDRYLAWLRSRLDGYGVLPPGVGHGDPLARAMATALGLSLWNATPLPSHGLRPRPQPKPERNRPCPCGSGQKYKRCCAGVPPLEIGHEEVLALVLDRLPGDALEEAVASGKAPPLVILEHAQELLEQDSPKVAARLLEQVLAAGAEQPTRSHGLALQLLCDAYQRLGYSRKKRELVDSAATAEAASPLRCEARQRLAAIRMDEGDFEGAFEAFRGAMRDDPDSPGLGVLEVQLLLADGRTSEARQRAQWWLARRRRDDDAAQEVELLERLADDPTSLMRVHARDLDPRLGRLQEAVAAGLERPLPSYHPSACDIDAADALRQMGLSSEEIDLELPDGDAPDDAGEADDDDLVVLAGPAELRAVEDRWREVFPDGKPFGSHDQPFGGSAAWSAFDEWIEFVEGTPSAFDSLEILDDLATAVLAVPEGGETELLSELVGRAAGILSRAAAENRDLVLSWRIGDNRPGLRSLFRRFRHLDDTGARDESIAAAELLLRLDPEDSHGVRSALVNEWLRRGENERALAICDRYPGDFLPDTVFGAALALFRLGRRAAAEERLRGELSRPSKVPRYLERETVQQPRFSEFGVTVGGDDQAWLYRREMRGAWKATPGAIPWLVKTCRAIERERPRDGGEQDMST